MGLGLVDLFRASSFLACGRNIVPFLQCNLSFRLRSKVQVSATLFDDENDMLEGGCCLEILKVKRCGWHDQNLGIGSSKLLLYGFRFRGIFNRDKSEIVECTD